MVQSHLEELASTLIVELEWLHWSVASTTYLILTNWQVDSTEEFLRVVQAKVGSKLVAKNSMKSFRVEVTRWSTWAMHTMMI